MRIAARSAGLRVDFGDALRDPIRLGELLEANPIAAWCGGRGTGGVAYFDYSEGASSARIKVADEPHEHLREMTREIVNWRPAEYLRRSDA